MSTLSYLCSRVRTLFTNMGKAQNLTIRNLLNLMTEVTDGARTSALTSNLDGGQVEEINEHYFHRYFKIKYKFLLSLFYPYKNHSAISDSTNANKLTESH